MNPDEMNTSDVALAMALEEAILKNLPDNGSSIGNKKMLTKVRKALNTEVSEEEYKTVRDQLASVGLLDKWKGRGGSVRLPKNAPDMPKGVDTDKENEPEELPEAASDDGDIFGQDVASVSRRFF